MKTKLNKLNNNIQYTLTTMNAQSKLFDQYLRDQQDKVEAFQPEYTKLMMQLETAQRELRMAQKSREQQEDLSVELLREIASRVKIDLKSEYKRYFPENFSIVTRKSSSLLTGYQVIQRVIGEEQMESILAFSDDITLTYQSLIDANNLVADKESDEKVVQSALNQLYINWSTEYQRLKWFIRGILHGGTVDFQIFFKNQPIKRRHKTKIVHNLQKAHMLSTQNSVTPS